MYLLKEFYKIEKKNFKLCIKRSCRYFLILLILIEKHIYYGSSFKFYKDFYFLNLKIFDLEHHAKTIKFCI